MAPSSETPREDAFRRSTNNLRLPIYPLTGEFPGKCTLGKSAELACRHSEGYYRLQGCFSLITLFPQLSLCRIDIMVSESHAATWFHNSRNMAEGELYYRCSLTSSQSLGYRRSRSNYLRSKSDRAKVRLSAGDILGNNRRCIWGTIKLDCSDKIPNQILPLKLLN